MSIDELIDEFADLDEREACELLDELGQEIPQVPESVYDDKNLVPGCQSRVWVVNHLSDSDPPTIQIEADSDAFVVKGLIYVVMLMFNDRSAEEILDVNYVSTFDRLGLGRLILPQRKNGLYSMVHTIRKFAAESLGQSLLNETAAQIPALPIPTRADSVATAASEFPVLQTVLPSGRRPIFLDSAASAQKPRVVIEKEREVEQQYYANAFRGKYYFGQRVDDEIESTRTKVASLIGAQRSDEVIFTAGTTMAINTVASSWGQKFLNPGDEIVVTEMEHHANFVPWQVIAKQRGAVLKIVPITPEGRLDERALDRLVGEKTKMVAVCSMSNVLGTLNPLEPLVSKARRHGAAVLVDAAQSIPHLPVHVQELDVDFLTFSGHKLYGPSGVGVLYGKHELLSEMEPFLYGGHMIKHVGPNESTWADPPAKFEAGTPPIVQIIGLGAAIDFFSSYGYEAVARHESALLRSAHRRLESIQGLTIYGPPASAKGALVSFTVAGTSTEDIAIRLNDRGIFTRHGHHCAMILHNRLGVPATTRASFGIYNTEQDVEALGDAIEDAIADLKRPTAPSRRR